MQASQTDKKGEASSEKKKKSALREWIDSIVFAVVVATLIRWLFIEAYMIPTPSMESSLMVGDYLFVSKMHYGARTPQTPLQLPLTFQKIWGTDIPSYLNWIELPMLRLPSISEVKNNDPVVFNCPADPNDPADGPVDVRTYYIKRCIAIPGDVLEIKDQQVYINGQAVQNPVNMQHAYFVCSKQIITEDRVFDRNGIHDYALINHKAIPDLKDKVAPNDFVYSVYSSADKLEALKRLDFIYDIIKYKAPSDSATNRVPVDRWDMSYFGWGNDNFGPLQMPKAGQTIQLTTENIAKYGYVIVKYEYNKGAFMKDGKVFVDGKEISEYTFKQGYYYMMGDNRHNSSDSRVWGFVPADHIVGKALFTWWSVDSRESWSNPVKKVRWERIFKGID